MSNRSEQPEFDRCRYRVAIICALRVESTAVEACFDQTFDSSICGKAPRDTNSYRIGQIGQNYVVLTYLSSKGKAASATSAANLRSSFINIQLALLVGVCGSVPDFLEDGRKVDIHLGDVIISTGVVQHDFGRQYDTGPTVRKNTIHDNLGRPTTALGSFIHKCQSGIEGGHIQERLQQYVKDVCSKSNLASYSSPPTTDILYCPDYLHKHRPANACSECLNSEEGCCEKARQTTCEELGCESHAVIERERPFLTKIHWGLMASGDSVIRSG